MIRISIALLLSVLSSLPANGMACEAFLQKTVLETRPAGRTVLFHFPATPGEAGPDHREAGHLAWVRSHTAWDAHQILENHVRILRDALSGMQPDDGGRSSLEGSLRNSERILSGEVGRFRAPACLDQVAFREFLQVVDLRDMAQEFLAYVYGKGTETIVIGDFDRKPDSVIGVTPSSRLTAEATRLVGDGWMFQAHLHNHPFVFDNPSGDIGPIAPSMPDIATWKAGMPLAAWITNGVEVLEIDQADYQQLE